MCTCMYMYYMLYMTSLVTLTKIDRDTLNMYVTMMDF